MLLNNPLTFLYLINKKLLLIIIVNFLSIYISSSYAKILGEKLFHTFFYFFLFLLDFLRPAFGHGRLGHPQSLEYFYSVCKICRQEIDYDYQ